MKRLRGHDGQALVEFALVLPLFVTLVFVVIECGITFNRYLRVTDIARVAARDAATARLNGQSNACTSARNTANSAAGELSINVTCSPQGQPGTPFTVTVKTPYSISFPLLPFRSQGDLTSAATERLE